MRAFPGLPQVKSGADTGRNSLWGKEASVRFGDFLAESSQQGVK
jgi:hypothetical protein